MRKFVDRVSVRPFKEVVNLRIFNNRFPDRPPVTRFTVFRTVERFENTGSVKDRERLRGN